MLNMTTRDVVTQINQMYRMDISTTLVSNITAKIIPRQSRLLEAVYPNTEIQRCLIHQIRNSSKQFYNFIISNLEIKVLIIFKLQSIRCISVLLK